MYRACSDMKIPIHCLEIVRLLWTKLRSVLKMQLEAIFNGVFCNSLHWTIASLDPSNPNFPRDPTNSSNSNKTSTLSANGSAGREVKATRRVDPATEEFTGEMLSSTRLFAASFEILDCLVDLLAEPTLLPDLYVNYDCDGNRSDLTQNIFDLLSQVAQHSHAACRETHNEAHFLWAQGISELALRGLFNALYVVYLRSQHRQPKLSSAMAALTAANGTSISSEDDDGLLEETSSGVTSPRDSAGYATADALYKRRQRKKFFQHGIQEFNRKPIAGIKYLQQNTFLPTPLDTKSLAGFMRSLPQGLNKNAVGAYLGAMGKDVKEFEKAEIHEADTMEFHREVLVDFVKSFNFEGENIVAALRMFLASFRLPGEAQQIDRILNTFSLQVYEQCRDRFLMASPDVAYLLSFSLIMLNTDLHNVNIRPEKKMKLEDFVKNNKNYGQEVSSDRDLPDDFLAEIYQTIAFDEIKTFEDGGKHGEVTNDRWKDLVNQAENDPQNSRLIVHHRVHESNIPMPFTAITVDSIRAHAQSQQHSQRQSRHVNPRLTQSRAPSRDASAGSRSRSQSRSKSFNEKEENGLTVDVKDQLEGDGEASPHHNYYAGDQYDRQIFELIQLQLVCAFASVFQQFVDASNDKDGVSSSDGDAPSLLDENSSQSAYYVPEKSMLQLAGNGLVLCAGASSHLALPEHFNAIFSRICKYTALFESEVYPMGYNRREEGVWLFCSNQSAPVATAGMLKLVNTRSLWLNSESWALFFHAISALREFQALPSRLLYQQQTTGAGESSLTTESERINFVELVYQNKDEIQRREDLKTQDLTTTTESSGGFFSGMAWFMSAFESNPNSSFSSSTSLLNRSTFEGALPSNPAEWAEYAHDLVIQTPRDDVNEGTPVDDVEFGSEKWIRSMLQPYRLEVLVEDLSKLPSRALVEVIKALDDELTRTLTGVPSQQVDGRKQRPGRHRSDEGGSQKTVVSQDLSPAGCVLFEHFLSQIISQSDALVCDGGKATDDDEDVFKIIEAHYFRLLQTLLPVLSSVEEPDSRRISYETACFILQKAIDGVFTLATKIQSERARALLMTNIELIVESSGDDGLVRPFLSQILSGLNNFFASTTPSFLQYTQEQWLVVMNLISWSVNSTFAAAHGFAVLEYLVKSQIWRVDGSELSISDCYTKLMMFALAHAEDGSGEKNKSCWDPKRPMELLQSMFSSLDSEDAAEDTEELALRFLGGSILACRQLLKSHELPADQGLSTSPNELIVTSLGLIQEMLLGSSSRSKSLFSTASWLEILQHGILPLGVDILNEKSSVGLIEGDSSAAWPCILYYQQQLPVRPTSQPPSSLQRRGSQSPRPTNTGKGRRRRPSVVKDPFALRPHVVMVQLISGVVCEELSQLSQLESFLSVWEEVVDLLISLLRHTQMESNASGSGNSEVPLAALERRSVLSTHEEILEHVKGITRRLFVLQQDDDSSSSAVAQVVHTLVEKCQPYPGLFEQLFPSREDASSSGENTPPLVDDGNLEEDDDGNAANEAA